MWKIKQTFMAQPEIDPEPSFQSTHFETSASASLDAELESSRLGIAISLLISCVRSIELVLINSILMSSSMAGNFISFSSLPTTLIKVISSLFCIRFSFSWSGSGLFSRKLMSMSCKISCGDAFRQSFFFERFSFDVLRMLLIFFFSLISGGVSSSFFGIGVITAESGFSVILMLSDVLLLLLAAPKRLIFVIGCSGGGWVVAFVVFDSRNTVKMKIIKLTSIFFF